MRWRASAKALPGGRLRRCYSGTVLAAAAMLLIVLAESAPTPAPAATSSVQPASACSLLTGAEISASQGSELVEAGPTDFARDGVAVSRCFYRTRDMARSVSLDLNRADPAGHDPEAVRHRWQTMFHGKDKAGECESAAAPCAAPTEEAEERGREEGEPESKPEPVAALGDEAFWLGTSAFGALYVLDGDLFLRLSAGGPGDREAKLAQSRALATKALARLAGAR